MATPPLRLAARCTPGGMTTAAVLHNLSWPLTPSLAQLLIRSFHLHLRGLYQAYLSQAPQAIGISSEQLGREH